jgi:hypothetical protein
MAIMDQAKNEPLPIAEKRDFKSPEGFGNVIGVGANPVMEAMNAQLEEQQKQTALLERIAGGSSGTDGWINNTTPSRAAMLKPL